MQTKFEKRGYAARLAGESRDYVPSEIDGETDHAMARNEFARGWDNANRRARQDRRNAERAKPVKVSTTIDAYTFERCESLHDIASALSRLAQIMAFNDANGLSDPRVYVEIVALLAKDAERIDDNT